MQRQLDKLVGQIGGVDDSLGNAFKKAPADIDKVSKSLGKTRFETANVAAQFQDIAVQLQGGASPLTIALQQGTQLSQVLGARGTAGAVGLLGAAFTSLLNPVSLATIGIIALGGYAVKYGAEAIGAVDDLDDKLKAHGELIKSLKDAYGEAGKGIDTSVKESVAVLQTLLGLSTDALKKQFDSLARSVSNSITDVIAVTDSIGGSTVIETAAAKYDKFRVAIDNFREGVNAGKPDVLAFRAALAELINSDVDDATKKKAKALYDLSEGAAKAQLAIEGTTKAAREFSLEALNAAEQGNKFAAAMKKLDSSVAPKLTDREKIMRDYTEALVAAGGTEERLAAARNKDAKLAILADNERKEAAEKSGKSAESAVKRFDSALASAQKNAATTASAAGALGLGAGALARMTTEARLTEAAMQAFGKVSDDVKTKITAQANAAGEAADKLARARIASNTEFGAKTAFLTPEDAQIASQLASIYGNDIPRALQSTEASGIRAVNTLREISHVGQEINRGFLLDFTQQIRNGASAMDALKAAGLNALGKISDKLVSMAADNLWNSAFGGGGSGGLGGLFSSFFGGTSGPTTVTGLGAGTGGLSFPMFASGTKSAPGGLAIVGEKGPELVNLPRGAEVIPNHELPGAMGGTNVTVEGATVVVQGDASERTLGLIKQALAQHDAALPAKVVTAVRAAKKTRQL